MEVRETAAPSLGLVRAYQRRISQAIRRRDLGREEFVNGMAVSQQGLEAATRPPGGECDDLLWLSGAGERARLALW